MGERVVEWSLDQDKSFIFPPSLRKQTGAGTEFKPLTGTRPPRLHVDSIHIISVFLFLFFKAPLGPIHKLRTSDLCRKSDSVGSLENLTKMQVDHTVEYTQTTSIKLLFNRPFPSCFEPHYESEAKRKVFVMKISLHSYVNKTNFRMKSFARSLVFIVRFTATRKWPIWELNGQKVKERAESIKSSLNYIGRG